MNSFKPRDLSQAAALMALEHMAAIYPRGFERATTHAITTINRETLSVGYSHGGMVDGKPATCRAVLRDTACTLPAETPKPKDLSAHVATHMLRDLRSQYPVTWHQITREGKGGPPNSRFVNKAAALRTDAVMHYKVSHGAADTLVYLCSCGHPDPHHMGRQFVLTEFTMRQITYALDHFRKTFPDKYRQAYIAAVDGAAETQL